MESRRASARDVGIRVEARQRRQNYPAQVRICNTCNKKGNT